MDAFRLGIMVVAVSAAVMMLAIALPVLAQTLIELVPSVLILAFTFWILKAMISKLMS